MQDWSPVLKDHIFMTLTVSAVHVIYTCYERPPVLRDHGLVVPRGGLSKQDLLCYVLTTTKDTYSSCRAPSDTRRCRSGHYP